MAKSIITPEEGDELRKLYGEQHALYRESMIILASGAGMESPAFVEAERKLSVVVRRIREILGISGQHWAT